MSFTRRRLLHGFAATGLATGATPVFAKIDKAVCDLEREHRGWRIYLSMRAHYDKSDTLEGLAAYIRLEHISSGLTLNLRTGRPDAVFEALNRDYAPVLDYKTEDVLPLFTSRFQPEGPETASTFVLIENPDADEERYVIWDYDPDPECSDDEAIVWLCPELRDDSPSTRGWNRKMRTPKNEAATVFTLLFKTDRPKVHVGYYDRFEDTWPRFAVYDLDTTGLRQAIDDLIRDGNERLLSRPLDVCGTPEDFEPCFLTTACCTQMGRVDDCAELRALRRFRDGWLARHPQGATLIAEYYRTAPGICAAIARDAQGARRLRALYWGTILPCVAAIRLGANGLAFRLYCRMMRRLQAAYLQV